MLTYADVACDRGEVMHHLPPLQLFAHREHATYADVC
jgi:hypothetical protein